MAENNKTEKSKLQPNGGFYDDVQARDQFICVALRELIAQQIAAKKTGEYAVVGDQAVRYANAVMESRGKIFAKTVGAITRGVPVQPQVVVVPGAEGPALPPGAPVPTPPADLKDLDKNLGEIAEALNEGELPKNPVPSIADQLGGNLPPLAEVTGPVAPVKR